MQLDRFGEVHRSVQSPGCGELQDRFWCSLAGELVRVLMAPEVQ